MTNATTPATLGSPTTLGDAEMMSRKHYIAMAAELKFVKPSKVAKPKGYADRDAAWRSCVQAVADVFKRDNSHFDRERFLTACGFSDPL